MKLLRLLTVFAGILIAFPSVTSAALVARGDWNYTLTRYQGDTITLNIIAHPVGNNPNGTYMLRRWDENSGAILWSTVKIQDDSPVGILNKTGIQGATSAGAETTQNIIFDSAVYERLPDDKPGEIVGTLSGASYVIEKRYVPGSPNNSATVIHNAQIRIGERPCPDDINIEAKTGSMDLTIPLGMGSFGGGNGSLRLYRENLPFDIAQKNKLFHWSSLSMAFPSDFQTRNYQTGALGQIFAPNFVVEATPSGSGYKLSFYPKPAVYSTNTNNNLIIMDSSPFKVITVTNVSTTNDFGLKISYDGVEKVFRNNHANKTWELTDNHGINKEITQLNSSEQIWTRSVFKPGNPDVLVKSHTKVFERINQADLLVQEVFASSPPLTNFYVNYHDSTNFGRLKEVVRYDGSWEKYTYDTNVNSVASGFENASISLGDSNNWRVIATNYSGSTRIITETIGNKVLYKKFITTADAIGSTPASITEEIGLSTSAAFGTASNLKTTKKFDSKGRLISIVHPDGTLTTKSYSTAGTNYVVMTNITAHGATVTGTNVHDGYQTVEIVGRAGEMLTNLTYRIEGGGILQQAPLSRAIYTNAPTDYFKKHPTVTYLDGTSNSVSGCYCQSGNPSEARDPDGVESFFIYDALNRLTGVTRRGLFTTNIFDAAGNLLGVQRKGTNGTTEEVLSRVYDLMGRMTSETVQGRGTTIIAETINTNSQLVRTYTYTNGGTRIETYYRDGSLERVTGTAAIPVSFDYGVATEGNVNFFTIKETRGTNPDEYQTLYLDMARRPNRLVDADDNGVYFYYNSKGQLEKVIDTDNVTQAFSYNPRGELEFSGFLSSTTGTNNPTNTYRLLQVTNEVLFETNGSDVAAILSKKTFGYPTSNDANRVLLEQVLVHTVSGVVERRAFPTGNAANVYVTERLGVKYAVGGYRYVTNQSANGAYSLQTYSNGLLVAAGRFNSAGGVMEGSVLHYDEHERLKSLTDLAGVKKGYTYENGFIKTSTTTPISGSGLSAQTVEYFYTADGLQSGTLESDGVSTTTNLYYLNGLLRETYGVGKWPVKYAYDSVGRMRFMTNWGDHPATGTRVTEWRYDHAGRLTNKFLAGTTSQFVYTYTDGSRVQTVTSPNNVQTTYAYLAGQLSKIFFNTNTVGITNQYNRLGQIAAVQHGTTVTTYGRNLLGQITSESYAGGPLNGVLFSRGLDEFLRLTNVTVNSNPGTVQSFGYDSGSRLHSASTLGYSATYGYNPNSSDIDLVSFKQLDLVRLVERRTHDGLLRLKNLAYTNGAGSTLLSKLTNTFDALNRLSTVAFDGIQATIGYDPIGQLAGVTNRWADDASQVAGQRWAFTFDDIGNRTLMKSGGDSSGANLRDTKYTPTTANRYAGITNSGKFQLIGEADSGTVYIANSSSGVTRHGAYFHKELGLDVAGSGTQLLTKINLTNGSTYAPTITGAVYIAPTNEIPTYTSNGNLLTDGRWVYQWNALDRLTRLDRRNPSDPIERIEFQYDHAGRRTQKTVTYTNAVVVTNKFVYDGWRLIAEMDGGNNLVRSYLWGADLTQSLDGGAGVGGLVGVNIQTNGFYFATSDGRGNVTSLIRAQSSTPSVRYDYSPFGEVIRASGDIAKLNPIRFSSKYYDDEAGVIYYGERYYHPAHGRWVSPDPLGELGGLNLYGFVGNDPYNYYDPYGLALRDWVNGGWLEGLQEGAGNLRNSLAGLIEVPKQALRTVLTPEGREQALHTLNSIRLLLNELPNDPCLQEELKRLLGQEYDNFIAELQTAEGLSRFLINAGVSGLTSGGTALVAKSAGSLNKVIQIIQRVTPNIGGRRGGGGGGSPFDAPTPLEELAAEGGAKITEPSIKGFGNIGGGITTVESALGNAQKWLGPGYKEIAPGVYRSADNTRQFRMTVSDLTDSRQGPHVHFEAISPDGRTIIENSHVAITNP